MTRLLAFLFFVSFANCCQRKNEVMSCHRLPETNERMVGVSILIVERVFGEKVDLRGFQLSRIMIKFSEVTCDGLLFGRDTQVFLGDKMCPIVSKHILSLIFFFFIYVHFLFKMDITQIFNIELFMSVGFRQSCIPDRPSSPRRPLRKQRQ